MTRLVFLAPPLSEGELLNAGASLGAADYTDTRLWDVMMAKGLA